MKHLRPINIWTTMMLVLAAGIWQAAKYGVFSMILIADPTFISFGIMFIFLLISISIGYKTLQFSRFGVVQPVEYEWFFRNELASLGLIGTIIGMMLILGPAFAAIDPTLSVTISAAIADISLGIGTALWTTIIALISSFLIGLQLINLEYAQNATPTVT